MQEIRLKFDDIRETIPGGDVFLWRAGYRPWSWLIARGDRTIYSHAGMSAWWSKRTKRFYPAGLPSRRLVILDTLQWHGGRVLDFDEDVKRHSGRWDWYKVAPYTYSRRLAVDAMAEIVGRPYGWPALLRAAVRNAALIRWLIPPNMNDKANGHLPHCVMACSQAMRAGHVDPVHNLADRVTGPGDLARSAALVYQGTLY